MLGWPGRHHIRRSERRTMLGKLSIKTAVYDGIHCVTYELADETGIVVECGAIPQSEFDSLRSELIADLAAKGDNTIDMLDYMVILFALVETAL